MNEKKSSRLHAFASLHWYDETIKFIFAFVTKTSELLLAAGIVVSTANFLTDGDVMRNHQGLSDAWAWAQAIAIDASLGIVFVHAIQAARARDRIKAVIFSLLTVLLASVAGLITHFDAYAHAAGLPVTDQRIVGIIPLWVMTGLRAVAVIGFLLTIRLKDFSFTKEESSERSRMPFGPPAEAFSERDDQAMARALLHAMQQAGLLSRLIVTEEHPDPVQIPPGETARGASPPLEEGRDQSSCRGRGPKQGSHGTPLGITSGNEGNPGSGERGSGNWPPDPKEWNDPTRSTPPGPQDGSRSHHQPGSTSRRDLAADHTGHGSDHPVLVVVPRMERAESGSPQVIPNKDRIAQAYMELQQERAALGQTKPISAKELASRARVRRATCSLWLRMIQPLQEPPEAETMRKPKPEVEQKGSAAPGEEA